MIAGYRSEVARGLSCSSWSLGRWLAAKQNGGALTQPKTLAAETPEQRENRRLRQENDYPRLQRDIQKKGLGHCLGRQPERRFQLMNALKSESQVEALAQPLEVSLSG